MDINQEIEVLKVACSGGDTAACERYRAALEALEPGLSLLSTALSTSVNSPDQAKPVSTVIHRLEDLTNIRLDLVRSAMAQHPGATIRKLAELTGIPRETVRVYVLRIKEEGGGLPLS